ncbi:MAG: hypothetical protein LHW49_01125 [Candidatus Cloacimonetes bacterium]|nr:hypothetical protein [Candidatus Cloacimonadota bacterium]
MRIKNKKTNILSIAKYILLVAILFANTLLWAQYDEKKIMLNQAQSFENLNQFMRAQQIYQDLLQKFPNDNTVIQKLYYSHMRLSEFDKADTLIESKKNVLSPVFYTQSKITILCKNNNLKEAIKLADSYIKKNPSLVNNYQFIAITFEQNLVFESAINYYLQARKVTNNKKLFSYELANNYYNLMDYYSSIFEYVTHLESNKSYLYITSNKFKEMVKKDSTLIKEIEKQCAQSEVEEVRELYALSLVEIDDFASALNVYSSLSLDKFIKFADDLYAKSFYQLAQQSYEQIITKDSITAIQLAEIKYKIAQIYYDQKFFNETKDILNQIVQMKELDNNQLKYRTKVHFEARKLLANILMIENASKQNVLAALSDAESYVFNTNDKKHIAFIKVHYLTMNEYYQEAENLLAQTIKGEEYGSAIIAKSLQYQFELYLMQNDNRADSLLTEFIMFSPEDNAANDMLFLSLFVNNLDENRKQEFLKAYRLKQTFQNSQAIDKLEKLVLSNPHDEIKLLLADWLIEDWQIDKAKEVYNSKFDNEAYYEFAQLELARLKKNNNDKKQNITDYLKNKPNSVFSPLFRQLLTKTQANRG